MDQDYEETPSFSSRSFEITLYSRSSTGPRMKVFEGQTTSMNRYGLEAHVNPVGRLEDSEEDWHDSSLIVKFHAISSALTSITGTVQSMEPADHMLYRWKITIHFEEELDLLKVHLE